MPAPLDAIRSAIAFVGDYAWRTWAGPPRPELALYAWLLVAAAGSLARWLDLRRLGARASHDAAYHEGTSKLGRGLFLSAIAVVGAYFGASGAFGPVGGILAHGLPAVAVIVAALMLASLTCLAALTVALEAFLLVVGAVLTALYGSPRPPSPPSGGSEIAEAAANSAPSRVAASILGSRRPSRGNDGGPRGA